MFERLKKKKPQNNPYREVWLNVQKSAEAIVVRDGDREIIG